MKKIFQEKMQQDVLKHLDDFIKDPNKKKQLIVTEGVDQKVLKQLIDALYDKIKAETLFLINVSDQKITYLCKSEHNDANELVKLAASLSFGSGGGKGQFAQGGTQDLSHFDEVKKELEKRL